MTLNGEALTGWDMFTLPMTDVAACKYATAGIDGPAFYRGKFEVSKPGDTFLDLRGWSKGAVWVNGHALGRFWNIGPQRHAVSARPVAAQAARTTSSCSIWQAVGRGRSRGSVPPFWINVNPAMGGWVIG